MAKDQRSTAQLNEQIAKNFDMEGQINSYKQEAANAKKQADDIRSKSKRDEDAKTSKISDLEARLDVSILYFLFAIRFFLDFEAILFSPF